MYDKIQKEIVQMAKGTRRREGRKRIGVKKLKRMKEKQ